MQLIRHKVTGGTNSVSFAKLAGRTLTTVLLLTLTIQPLLAETTVTARFNPPRIAMGDRAQYIVELSETDSSRQPEVERVSQLPIPQTSAVRLSNGRISNSSQSRLINGAAEFSVTQSFIIDASPTKIGGATIPAYTFKYKGSTIEVPAATLQVVERSADAAPTQDELIFLKAELPDTLYVGQTIAFNIKLYVEEDVQLRNLNSFDRSADGFTISELPEDTSEGIELLNEWRYRTLTWPLTLTPIQTGEQQISFQFTLTARLPSDGKSRDPFGGRSPFGGSLLDDLLGRSERLNVYTDNISINVRPLPENGQPESFSGAIGDLALEVGADAEQAVENEPIMLSVVLKGQANFERITGPEFADSPDWKHYAPEIKFEASDALGLKGSQRFDYVFIPQRAGDLELPETRFSYFDPKKEEYVELTAPAITVKVTPGQQSFGPAPIQAQPAAAKNDLALSKKLTPEKALLTLEYRPKPARPVGYDILSSRTFIGVNVLVGLLLVGSSVALRIRKRNRDDPAYPIRSGARQSLREAKLSYHKAAQAGDAEDFYRNGQFAIRHAATMRTGRSMQSANSADIEMLLDGQAAKDCRDFFAAANAQRFSGNTAKNISDARQQIERILKAL